MSLSTFPWRSLWGYFEIFYQQNSKRQSLYWNWVQGRSCWNLSRSKHKTGSLVDLVSYNNRRDHHLKCNIWKVLETFILLFNYLAWLYRGYAVRCLLLTNYWWMYDRFNLDYKAWYMTNQKYNDDADKKFCGTLTRPVNNMAIVLIKYSFFIFEQYDNIRSVSWFVINTKASGAFDYKKILFSRINKLP